VFAELGGLCSAALVRAAEGRWSEPAAAGFDAPVFASGCRAFGSNVAGTTASDAALGRLASPLPDDEPLVIAHLNGDAAPISALHRTVHPSR
jgi:hypothetical protein